MTLLLQGRFSVIPFVFSVLMSFPAIADPIGPRTSDPTPTIPEFHQVNENLYRGGRPSREDLDYLKSIGVRSIINLEHTQKYIERERAYAKKIGLAFASIPLSADVYPSDGELELALKLLQDSTHFPIFIHCKHGQDRTGLIVGLWRVFADEPKWKPKAAYEEMLKYGFHPEYKAMDQCFRDKTGMGRKRLRFPRSST